MKPPEVVPDPLSPAPADVGKGGALVAEEGPRGPKLAKRAAKAGALAVIALSVTVAGCSASPASSRPTGTNPFFSNRFAATVNPHTFGQDPSWTADGRVLSNEKDRTGTSQIYVSRLDGTNMSCLTCGQAGPNGFPQE
jgi:hypothetical protein